MKEHRCCPFILQTWVALSFLLIIVLGMSFMQLYSDSLPEYPPECISMYDFAFRFLPRVNVKWLADVWIVVSVVLFFVFAAVGWLETPQLAIRRYALVLGLVFFMRTLIIADTRYPTLRFDTERYQPSNWLLGALAIVAGVRHTATDMMFSGHTTNWILTGAFVARYSNFAPFSTLFWLFNVTGIVILLAEGEHYLADVGVAIIISGLSFICYHLLYDSVFLRYFYPGIILEVRNGQPIMIEGKEYKTWDENRTVSWVYRWWRWTRWLDAE